MPESETQETISQRIVDDLMEEFRYREQSQFSWKSRTEQWWRRWHADPSLVLPNRRDPNWQTGNIDSQTNRPKLKDWQHFILNPHGFVNERAQTTAMTNLICEASPIFKARGYHDEDLPTESPLEALDNYMFAVLNPATEWINDSFTRSYVQGCAPIKLRYLNESFEVNLLPRQWDVTRFQQALKTARDVIEEQRAKGDSEAMDPPGIMPDGKVAALGGDDVQAFAQWAAKMQEKYGVQVPMPPVGRKERMYRHVGLSITHVELLDIFWDPKIDSMRKQKRIFQRLIADKAEVLAYAKRENERAAQENRPAPFNLPAIEATPEGVVFQGTPMSTNSLQERLMQIYGITETPIADPSMKRAIEIVEAWEPETSTWCWVGQRSQPLTNYGCYPFSFPLHPYACYINIPTPGQLVGKSNYDIHAASHDHLDTMRGYIADYYALTVAQPMYRTSAYGSLGETGRKLEIRPHEVLDAEMGEEYKPLYNFTDQLTGALNYANLLKSEIDQGMAIDDVTRGQSAQINRVGVGEVQLRAQNQQNRMRAMMYQLSTMCSRDLIPLGNLLIWQFGQPDHIRNVAGGMPFEPEEMLSTDMLVPGMQANHMVMPQAMMAEAALAIQQIQETIKIGGELGILVPGGKAALAVLGRLMTMQRMQGAMQIIQLAASDLKDAEAKASGQSQVEQLQQQLVSVQKEADALRSALKIPSAAELNAEMEAIKAGAQAQPQQAQPPGEPEGDEGMAQPQLPAPPGMVQ